MRVLLALCALLALTAAAPSFHNTFLNKNYKQVKHILENGSKRLPHKSSTAPHARHVNNDPYTVQTKNGAVKGFTETVGPASARAFYGIPYANPPTRWADPVPVDNWQGVKDATQFSNACPQQCNLPTYACPPTVAEDCLYLNIWTPLPQFIKEPLPVLFWVHGGHFEYGSGEGPLYDSTMLVNTTNTIVVTINYRLGALGFMYLDDDTNNYGIKDQFTALKWVQDNIAAFGGDTSRVTVYGQSAGGTSVSVMLTSPLFSSHQPALFWAAIIESNPLGLPMINSDDGLDLSGRIAAQLNCTAGDLVCLRAAPLNALLDAQTTQGRHVVIKDIWATFYAWAPAIGSVVPNEPLDIFMAGNATAVPIMIGTVEEEGRLFVYEAFGKSMGALEYDAIMTATFGLGTFLKVLAKYPSVAFEDNRDMMAQLVTDYLFACPARAASRAHADKNIVFLYRFNHSFEHVGAWQNLTFCEGHVCHAAELPFVFNVMYNNLFPFSQNEISLASGMSTAWATFATNGNSPGIPDWVQYDVANDINYHFKTPVEESGPMSGLRSEYCDFWDEIGYHF